MVTGDSWCINGSWPPVFSLVACFFKVLSDLVWNLFHEFTFLSTSIGDFDLGNQQETEEPDIYVYIYKCICICICILFIYRWHIDLLYLYIVLQHAYAYIYIYFFSFQSFNHVHIYIYIYTCSPPPQDLPLCCPKNKFMSKINEYIRLQRHNNALTNGSYEQHPWATYIVVSKLKLLLSLPLLGKAGTFQPSSFSIHTFDRFAYIDGLKYN